MMRSFTSRFRRGLGLASISSVHGVSPKRNRSLKQVTRAVVDALEQRRMLSVTLSNGVLTLTGTGGNDVATFAPSGSNLLVSDNGTNYSYALTSVNQIVVNLNHGNDSVTMSAGLSIPASLVGGNGDDTLVGSDGDDTLLGGAGLDSLSGAGGNDVLNGGTGADAMFGGSGVDRVDYFARTANLVITLNGIANDGEAGENDNIHTDVEHVIGGSGNDDITGSASNNSLVGNDGNDTLRGLTGDDTLQGNAGEDVLQGGQGADIVDGGTGIDWSLYDDNPDALNIVLNGLADDGSAGEGDNTTTENIRGGIGNDKIIGSSANNLIEGLDGNDIIKGMGGIRKGDKYIYWSYLVAAECYSCRVCSRAIKVLIPFSFPQRIELHPKRVALEAEPWQNGHQHPRLIDKH